MSAILHLRNTWAGNPFTVRKGTKTLRNIHTKTCTISNQTASQIGGIRNAGLSLSAWRYSATPAVGWAGAGRRCGRWGRAFLGLWLPTAFLRTINRGFILAGAFLHQVPSVWCTE